MRKVILLGMMAATVAGVGRAELSASGEVSVGVFSSYVWRGQFINDEAVLQPSATLSESHGFSLNTWANMDLTDNNASEDADTEQQFSEVDLTLAYELPLEGPVGLTVGVIQYTFPNTALANTAELFGSLAGNVLLSPTLSVYYDFDQADGFYASVGISHEFALGEQFTLTPSASIGCASSDFNEYYFGVDDDALNDGVLGLALAYAPNDNWSFTASAQYIALLDGDIEDGADAVGYHETEGLVGGLTATCSF